MNSNVDIDWLNLQMSCQAASALRTATARMVARGQDRCSRHWRGIFVTDNVSTLDRTPPKM